MVYRCVGMGGGGLSLEASPPRLTWVSAPVGVPLRARAALAAAQAVNRVSVLTGRGRGTTVGGNVALRIDPGVLGHAVAGRPVTIVTGTNGKTTTTALVAAALGARYRVASSRGSNMPQGAVAVVADPAPELVLEIDELYVARVIAQTSPKVLVLLNIRRDQLDRVNEMRRIATEWEAALSVQRSAGHQVTVVANVDDPLVVWAVGEHADVVWVTGGFRWTEDASLCPRCGRVWRISPGHFSCESCGFARPEPQWVVTGDLVQGPDGYSVELQLGLPGEVNRANAAMALATADVRGVELSGAVAAVEAVGGVQGRYTTVDIGGISTRLMLMKNPAAWAEAVQMLTGEQPSESGVARIPGPSNVVIVVNARTADGKDTSWLWDLDVEWLVGRKVAVAGDRRLDMALRLLVGGIVASSHADPFEAVAALGGADCAIVATYTAFQDLLTRLEVTW